MEQADFEYLRTFLKGNSGLVLSPDKGYLAESRLMPVARKCGLGGLEELIAAVRSGKDEGLRVEVIEAMTTNESYFYRDNKPFDILCDEVLPRIVEARKAAGAKNIRIWSAACSSGQEPYTICMILKQHPELLQGMAVEIVATDLSGEIIAKAKAGIYSQFEAQRGLPIQLLMAYFEQVGEHWQIKEDIRKMVTYRQVNLLHDLSFLGRFDIVFCRNVLIYFDSDAKTAVLQRIGTMMPEDGFLYLGGAESVIGITEAFEPCPGIRGVYAKTGTGGAPSVAARAAPLGTAAGLAQSA